MATGMDQSEVAERIFTFGDHSVRCMCRRDHEESAGVTLTLQMTVEEVIVHTLASNMILRASELGVGLLLGSTSTDDGPAYCGPTLGAVAPSKL